MGDIPEGQMFNPARQARFYLAQAVKHTALLAELYDDTLQTGITSREAVAQATAEKETAKKKAADLGEALQAAKDKADADLQALQLQAKSELDELRAKNYDQVKLLTEEANTLQAEVYKLRDQLALSESAKEAAESAVKAAEVARLAAEDQHRQTIDTLVRESEAAVQSKQSLLEQSQRLTDKFFKASEQLKSDKANLQSQITASQAAHDAYVKKTSDEFQEYFEDVWISAMRCVGHTHPDVNWELVNKALNDGQGEVKLPAELEEETALRVESEVALGHAEGMVAEVPAFDSAQPAETGPAEIVLPEAIP